MVERITHFSHDDHRLTLRIDADDFCKLCGLSCNGVNYSCKRCSFHIHKTCAELKREINHPFHPQHPLTLLSQPPPSSSEKNHCHACGKVSSPYTYHCSKCKFDLDLNCAALMPTKTTTEESSSHEKECKNNHYFCKPHPHPHPLTLCKTDKKIDVYCAGCKLVIENSSIYVCLECKSMLHKSCSEVPQVIKHAFHPDHNLTLLPRPPYGTGEFTCKACGGVHAGLTFHCKECEFDLDINCAFLMPVSTTDHQKKEQDQIDRFIICESSSKKNEFPFVCYACQLPFKDSGSSIYCCLNYNVLLHKSCAELPREIQHPLHRYHPLKFSARSRSSYTDKFECKACLREDYGCGYECFDCKFFLDIPCALSKPLVVNSIFHNHPLVFCDVVAKNLRCNICHQFRKSLSFRCLVCTFNAHLLCVPTLPLTASDGNHRHPLTLTKSWVRDYEGEDADAEFYCDRCENERRLQDPTYYCAECHYVAHVQCVIYEIVRFMEERWSLNRSNLAKSTDSSQENSNELVSSRVFIEEPAEETTRLTFFGDVADDLRCNTCHKYSNSNFFRCVACNFNLHCLCLLTLPSKIHHRFDMHPLILSPIKDIENHPSKFFCEVCERYIEPIGLIYHCAECDCSSHAHCVIPKTLDEMEEVWPLPYELGDIHDDIDGEIAVLRRKMNDQKEKLMLLMRKYVPDHELILEQLEIKIEELVDKKPALQNERKDSLANEMNQSSSFKAWLREMKFRHPSHLLGLGSSLGISVKNASLAGWSNSLV